MTIYNQFASNLSIDDNWNPFDYPRVCIIPLPFFLYVESLLCKSKFSVLPYTNCIHIVIQQTQTTESEVLHKILSNRPLTLLQNPNTTVYHQNRMSFQLVYHIRRFILSTVSNTLSLNPCHFNYCHSRRFQLYSPAKPCMILQHTHNYVPCGHLSYARTRGIMYYLRWSHMQGRSCSTHFTAIPICLAMRVS